MYTSRITGMGKYVPENVVTNDDLSKIMDTNDAWFTETTGFKERPHIIKDHDISTAFMDTTAVELALARCDFSKVVSDLLHIYI